VEGATVAQELVREALETYGFGVEFPGAPADPRQLLDTRQDLDFVVKGILDGTVASALVYRRDSQAVRRLEASGPSAARDLAQKLLRHLSSHSSIEALVAQRKAQSEAALAANPQDYDSLVLMGLALEQEGDYAAAIGFFDQALAIHADDADVRYGLALCHQGLGQTEAMIGQLRLALNADPEHEGASILLANTHLAAGRFHEAIAIYNRWLDSPLNASLAHWNLAVTYQRMDDAANALAHLRRIDRGDLQYVNAQQLILDIESQNAQADRAAPESQAARLPAQGPAGVPVGGASRLLVAVLALLAAVAVAVATAVLIVARRRQTARVAAAGSPFGLSSAPSPAAVRDTASLAREETARPSAAAPAEAGRVRDYRLLQTLGQGGMGTVYKALHSRLGKHFALKILSPRGGPDPGLAHRFEREMLAAGKLEHPHIVRATDAGEEDGTLFLVMEYVEGLDLGELVRRTGPLPVADACEAARHAALGLQYAHDRGLVHRDIKPSNLMLAACPAACLSAPSALVDPPSALVKVLDFGLALLREQHAGSGLTQSVQTMGTLDYMAPEQASDSHAVDIRADLYSLGCTLYKLLCGAAPFEDARHTGAPQKINAHASEAPAPILRHRPDVPAGVAAVLDKLLAKAPGDRYATPAEAAVALAPFCQGSDLAALLGAARTPAARLPDAEASRATDPDRLVGPGDSTRVSPDRPALVGVDLPSTVLAPARIADCGSRSAD
jgi:serine/threonine protein kinase/tetratricopeptide (TPR) repeat protein